LKKYISNILLSATKTIPVVCLLIFGFYPISISASEKDKYFARQCFKSIAEEWSLSEDNRNTEIANEYEYWPIRNNDDRKHIVEKLGKFRVDVRIQVVYGWGERKKQVRRCQLDEAGNVVIFTVKKGFEISDNEAGK